MNTRFATVFAALCLTVMALASGRAAAQTKVTGGGTVDSPGVYFEFSVSARSDEGGIVQIEFSEQSKWQQVQYTVTRFTAGPDPEKPETVYVTAVVTRSTTSRFPVGQTADFGFLDAKYRSDTVYDGIAWSWTGDFLFRPLRRGNININFNPGRGR
jgi:hypothetical protein